MAPTAPQVNHLLFADDGMLLFKANGQGSTKVSNLMDTYSLASEHRIKTSKSSILFSKGCLENVSEEVKSILNVHA